MEQGVHKDCSRKLNETQYFQTAVNTKVCKYKILPRQYTPYLICQKWHKISIFIPVAMTNYPQELAQDAVCQSHTGHMTGLWFLPNTASKAEC